MAASFVLLRLYDIEDNQILDCCFFFIFEEVLHHLESSADDLQKEISDLNGFVWLLYMLFESMLGVDW